MSNRLKVLIESKAPIAELKAEVAEVAVMDIPDAVTYLKTDARKGVHKLAEQLEKRLEKVEAEKARVENLFAFERAAWSKGFTRVAGVDEVGRGPLVGPVVAAAVILDGSVDWSGIDDSKKLSEAKRDYFYEKITTHAIAWHVGVVAPDVIDTVNILNATKLAMKQAINPLSSDYLLIDAVRLTDIPIEQEAIIKGDARSASIAAASIVAKVTRDRYMKTLHLEHPQYDFENNKGYGTPAHYAAIRKYGLIEEHRRSFLKNMKVDE